MSRKAREKNSFSTYYIKQIGSPEVSLFGNNKDRIKFIDILKKSKEKFDFKLYAYNINKKDYYELIIFDNGSDISSIMKSINISYSIYKKVSGKLFKDRYKSKIIRDYYSLIKTIKKIHSSDEGGKWNSCSEYSNKDNKTNFLDIEEILEVFNYEGIDSFDGYKNYLENNLDNEEFLCNRNVLLCNDISDCIKNKEEGRNRLRKILREKNYTYEELLKNKNERNHLIKDFRKKSILSLKDIGILFGGLSESTICKILNR